MRTEENKNRGTLFRGLWVDDRRFNRRVLACLMAAEVLLAYSPFGFIILPKISMTTLFLGVLVAALWGGPTSSAMVGLVFGLTSMWKASVTAVNPNDLIFSPVKSGNPMGSIVLALGPRMLFGVVAGLVYFGVLKLIPRNSKARLPVVMLVSALLERVHSMLTYLFMDKVFHVEGAYMGKAWTHLFSANRIRTYVMTMLILACVYCVYDRYLSRRCYDQYTQTKGIQTKVTLRSRLLEFMTVLVIALTALHLWERIQIVLFDIDQYDPALAHVDLIMQVIFQFVFAALSALYIGIVIYKHARNVEEIERIKVKRQLDEEKERAQKMELHSLKDPMTGVFNRKGLEKTIAEEKLENCPVGYLLIDIDHFKEINDSYGHEAGDLILKETAKCLKDAFGEDRVFRLGGDEFSVLTKKGLLCDSGNLMRDWNIITLEFARIHNHLTALMENRLSVTLSMGACYSGNGYQAKLYPLADSALYETKSHGRAGCTLVDPKGVVVARWKDPCAKTKDKYAELGHIGISRIVYGMNESIKPRLFCNESTRNLMGVPLEASPEECYEIWRNGIDKDDLEKLDVATKDLLKNGAVAYDYYWNHPIKGKIRVESGGTGKVENGMLSVIIHHQLFMKDRTKEHAVDEA